MTPFTKFISINLLKQIHRKNYRKRCPLCKLILTLNCVSYTSEGPPSKNLQTISAVEVVEKREPSYTVGGNIN